MHTKTVFIPHITLAQSLQYSPGRTLEDIEKQVGAKCTYEQNHPYGSGTVRAVVVDSPHAQVWGLCNPFAKNGGWWLE